MASLSENPEFWESFSTDTVSAAGLQNIDVDVDADATVQAESNSSSSASAENVKGNSGAVSTTSFNSGIQGLEGTNTFDIKADASIQGLAGTTSASSASTSEGVAEAFTELVDSAGIQDVSSLIVGGELNALGQSLNSISADAESVVGKAIGTSKLTGKIEGLEADGISVSSDAGIQGLAQLTNAAVAATSSGNAISIADAAKLQGADLNALDVDGIASIAGQTNLSNSASSQTVDGGMRGAKGAMATANLAQADGLRIGRQVFEDADSAIDVSSDATLTGLASIDNAATAAATSGKSTANSLAESVDGARINTADIGGVGSITGQINFAGSADASNVTDGGSTAKTELENAQGLQAQDSINVSSDAGLTGISGVDLTASSASTGAADSATKAIADAVATTLQGAELSNDTEIGGVGSIGGQIDFNGSAASSNVTGEATATGTLANLAQGLSTAIDTTTGFGTVINSDGTIQGFANTSLAATADTTDGKSSAKADGKAVDGASLGDLDIGGVGTVVGSANFAASADASNVTSGIASSVAQVESVDGLDLLNGSNGLQVASDAGIQGLADIALTAAGASTGVAEETTKATATADAGELQGAVLSSLTDIGGVGSITGQVNLTSAAEAANVVGMAKGLSELSSAEGLDLNATLQVASDATVVGTASIGSAADASTTNRLATATSTSDVITGADLSEGMVDIGGISSIAGQANFDLSASSTNVSGKSTAKADSADATGLIGGKGDFGIDVASDSDLSGIAIGSLTTDASSTAGSADAFVGDYLRGDLSVVGAALPSLKVGGVSDLTGAAQLDTSSTATSVDGGAQAYGGDLINVTGLTSGESDEELAAVVLPEQGVASTVSGTNYDGHAFNIDVASDSNITAQAFNNVAATATSVKGSAYADAYYDDITGIAAGMDVNIGGVSNLMAQAQGTAITNASSVESTADVFSSMSSIGVEELQMNVSSDSELNTTAALIGSADAESTESSASTQNTFDATAIDGIDMNIGGIGNLSATASVNDTSNASSVSSESTASSFLEATGLNSAHLYSSSDGDVSGIATITGDINSASTDGMSSATADFDADGITNIELGTGGLLALTGQAQVNGDVSASSVSGLANAFSGNTNDLSNSYYFEDTSSTSTITGLSGLVADGASDGTILGTAFGNFSTTAESISDDATANAAQSLTGIETANIDFGGTASIGAIAQDSNFVEASSVSGNASATASVNAIGLDGGDLLIASDAVITSSVAVDSIANASTIGSESSATTAV